MLKPESLNLLSLPSLSLEQRSLLPTTPCIYFAIDSQGVVQYIGKSNNPGNRWQSHHKGIELALIGGIRIAYLESEVDLLPEIERALITYFCPPLNQVVHKKSPVKGVMRVTFSKDFPGLGEQIREYRLSSSKSITQLAAEAGISVPHWNRIENEKVQELPLATLRGIERALGIKLGVDIDA